MKSCWGTVVWETPLGDRVLHDCRKQTQGQAYMVVVETGRKVRNLKALEAARSHRTEMRNQREKHSLHGHCGWRKTSLETFPHFQFFLTGDWSFLWFIGVLRELSPSLVWLLGRKGELFCFGLWPVCASVVCALHSDLEQNLAQEKAGGEKRTSKKQVFLFRTLLLAFLCQVSLLQPSFPSSTILLSAELLCIYPFPNENRI